ncbi:MAG: site-2 protease family protein, partial [Bifidobacteriaceae bacterium]|nr:site-2 protease family protein [Bifidobacteriaceae bacterium]
MSNVLAYILGIVVFVILLTISVAWHELGHMLPAKKFGVYVSQYFVGFGPTIWSHKSKKSGTEYGIKGIPLGGYTRMVGMYAPGDPARAERTGWRADLERDAHELTREELADVGESRAFYAQSVPHKLIIMLGGPVMNLILCLILMLVVFSGIGLQGTSTTLAQVAPCLSAAGEEVACSAAGAVQSPAAKAGFKAGDKVVSWDGTKIDSWDTLLTRMAASGTRTVQAVVRRDGHDVTLSVTPMAVKDAASGSGTMVGVTSAYQRVRQPVSTVPGMIWSQTTASIKAYIKMPATLWTTAKDTVTGAKRSEDSPMSIVGMARITGQISESSSALGSNAWVERIAMWLYIGGALNLALGIFNLIPLLPLDAGHVVG